MALITMVKNNSRDLCLLIVFRMISAAKLPMAGDPAMRIIQAKNPKRLTQTMSKLAR